MNPGNVGGYYQPGQNRKHGDVKPGSVRVPGLTDPKWLGGPDLPSFLLHNPLLEVMQVGATMRRVMDSKRKGQTQGITMGVLAGLLGLIEETPFIRETVDATKLFNPGERAQFFGELAKSHLVPQLVQWLASYTDKDAKGNPIQRKPTGPPGRQIGQTIKTGIPGLRETVRRKPGSAVSATPANAPSADQFLNQ